MLLWFTGSDRWTTLHYLATRRFVSYSLAMLAANLYAYHAWYGNVEMQQRRRTAWALGWLRRGGFVSRGDGHLWTITPSGMAEVERRDLRARAADPQAFLAKIGKLP